MAGRVVSICCGLRTVGNQWRKSVCFFFFFFEGGEVRPSLRYNPIQRVIGNVRSLMAALCVDINSKGSTGSIAACQSRGHSAVGIL